MKSYKTLQAMATKIAPFQCKINGMGVVQGELFRDENFATLLRVEGLETIPTMISAILTEGTL